MLLKSLRSLLSFSYSLLEFLIVRLDCSHLLRMELLDLLDFLVKVVCRSSDLVQSGLSMEIVLILIGLADLVKFFLQIMRLFLEAFEFSSKI